METLPDGNLKIVFKNTKGKQGDKGDGAIPIYQTLGQNADGAVSQKVVTDELTKIDNEIGDIGIVLDGINRAVI